MLYATDYVQGDAWMYYITKEYEDRDGGWNLSVRVERKKDVKAFAEWRLPDVVCDRTYGFSEQELLEMEEYLRDNESIMWDDYREEGEAHARRAE